MMWLLRQEELFLVPHAKPEQYITCGTIAAAWIQDKLSSSCGLKNVKCTTFMQRRSEKVADIIARNNE
jgi:hypothetical protein